MIIKKFYFVLLVITLLFLNPLSFLTEGSAKLITDQQLTIYNSDSSNPPETPTGKSFVKINIDSVFETSNIHPNQNPKALDIAYYFDWGDGTNTGWFGPLESGQPCKAVHRYSKLGVYEIKAKSCFIYYNSEFEVYYYGEHSNFSEPFTVNVRRYPIFDQIFFFIKDKLFGFA